MVILPLLEWGLPRKEARMLVFSFEGADGPSKLRDRSLFIAWGGSEDFGLNTMKFSRSPL